MFKYQVFESTLQTFVAMDTLETKETFPRMKKFNLMAIKISVWFGLLSISTWWGSRSVIRYWNQPLTTNMVYSFGDNENGIQFPLLTFCDDEFVSKKIKIECKVG